MYFCSKNKYSEQTTKNKGFYGKDICYWRQREK